MLDEDIAKCKELETSALSQLAGVSDGFGQSLKNDLEAQNALPEIAGSQAPLQGYRAIGEFATVDEVCQMFGRARPEASMWGALTVPDPSTDLPGQRIGGIWTPPQPQLSLLDLFTAVPMGQRNASWLQRSGVVTQADVVAPGAVQPAADLTYEAADGEAETVAVWLKANRVDLDDFDGLLGDIQLALSYGVRSKVEQLLVAVILGSTGIGSPDLTGWTDVDNLLDRVIVGAAEQKAIGWPPSFAAYNPLDVAQLEITKASGDGEYLAMPSGPPRVESVGIERGTVLLGDANAGAKIGVRSGLTIAVGQERNDLTTNRVTVLVETRILPMVITPTAFSEITSS